MVLTGVLFDAYTTEIGRLTDRHTHTHIHTEGSPNVDLLTMSSHPNYCYHLTNITYAYR
jgi:hypothetical protein